jgi:hypothetical protein
MEWLPELVSCDGNWVEIVERLYPIFKSDFVDTRATLDGLQVALRIAPARENKEFDFWHFITEGETEENRKPDLERCRRLRWFRAILDNAADQRLKRWEQKRNGRTTVAIGSPDFSYIVFLSKRIGADGTPGQTHLNF